MTKGQKQKAIIEMRLGEDVHLRDQAREYQRSLIGDETLVLTLTIDFEEGKAVSRLSVGTLKSFKRFDKTTDINQVVNELFNECVDQLESEND